MRYGIISDIHEDIVRLRSALSILAGQGIDEIICLGDVVGYSVPYYMSYFRSRNSNEVVELVRARCSDIVLGNHDLFAVRRLPHNRRFFDYPEDWYDLDYQERCSRAGGKLHLYEDNELPSLLSRTNCEYLASLPESIVKNCGDHKILLSHYAFPDCTGSSTAEITSSEQLNEHFAVMTSNGCIYGLSGNDHFEGLKAFTGKQVKDFSFGECYIMPNEPVWVHGPTVSEGAFRNGVMIYDSQCRSLIALPLNSPVSNCLCAMR